MKRHKKKPLTKKQKEKIVEFILELVKDLSVGIILLLLAKVIK